jgi:transposase
MCQGADRKDVTGMANPNTQNEQVATVGLDVGDRFSRFCCIGTSGSVLAEGQVRTREADIVQRLGSFPRTRIILEVGTHSPWISRLLRVAGHDVIVANPRSLALIRGSYTKTDRTDAETLARVGRLDPEMLKSVQHRGAQAQADLAVLRSRSALVRARTALINQVRGSVKAVGKRLPACDAHSFHKHAPGQIPEELRPALLPVVVAIAHLTEQIHQMDIELERIAEERYPETRLLRQVDGIGPVTSLAYVLTVDDPHRFPKSRLLGAYFGLVPRQRQSGDRSPQLSITKAGDRMGRTYLVQAAHYLLGPFGKDCDLRRWGLERLGRGGPNAKKRVVIAVARKLAVLLHRLWVNGAVYEPLRQQGGTIAA